MNSLAAVVLMACVAVATATSVLQTPTLYTGHSSYVLPRVVAPGYISSEYVKPVEVVKPVDVKAAVVPSTYAYGLDVKTGVVPSTYTYGSPVVYNSGYYPYPSVPVGSYPYNYPIYGYNYKI